MIRRPLRSALALHMRFTRLSTGASSGPLPGRNNHSFSLSLSPNRPSSAASMGDLPDSAAAGRSLPVREDCWSEDATATLIESWGRRYLDLNRGNLRQKDWQDVADAVNSLHAHTKKTHRSDVQCKNRIDTIKKKYKSEKARVSPSSWIFFDRLDSLIGPSAAARKPSPILSLALPLPHRKTPSPATPAVALPQKRPAADDGYFRRHFSAQAAAAAAAETDEEEEKVESEDEDDDDDEEGEGEGMMKLARVIERFGAMYERVEEEKLRQMVELEKQRMQFAKDLEVQRMQMFIDTQVHLERIKREKRSASNGERKF